LPVFEKIDFYFFFPVLLINFSLFTMYKTRKKFFLPVNFFSLFKEIYFLQKKA